MHEVAELAGVGASAVVNWRKRYPDFPLPIAELRSGPVFDKEHVQRWLRRRRTKVGRTIATINLKGGVAKSTTTVAMALIMNGFFGKRVLVIDLDPQTNATVMLIGEDRWRELNDAGHTLAQLFSDALAPDGAARFDREATLQRGVGDVNEAQGIDLLPSSLDLIGLQDRLATMPSGPFFSNVPTDILHRATRDLVDQYDYVLIDCPPNLGLITLNGLRIADGYIIPTIPDILSTYGIPQIETRIAQFAGNVGSPIVPLGIALTKVRQQSTVHFNTERQLRSTSGVPVFKTTIPESNNLAGAAEFQELGTVRQKLGYRGEFDNYYRLTKEIMESAQ